MLRSIATLAGEFSQIISAVTRIHGQILSATAEGLFFCITVDSNINQEYVLSRKEILTVLPEGTKNSWGEIPCNTGQLQKAFRTENRGQANMLLTRLGTLKVTGWFLLHSWPRALLLWTIVPAPDLSIPTTSLSCFLITC